jgi:hypothetical protein
MLTMNRTLDEKISSVDRVYLTDTDLVNLERFANSFSVRVKTYNLLRDLADEITVRSLKLLAQQYPELLQKHLQRCKYDMSIINSYQVTKECSTAYHLFQAVINEMLPAESAALVKPYSDMAIAALLHA